MVALARSWRPTEALPGARTWAEAQAAGQEALSGLSGHLAIEPPPDADSDGLGSPMPTTEPSGPAPAGHRLRLAVAAAARDGDQDAAALVREGPRYGLDMAELVAVAEAHWPKPRLHRRAFRAGRRWSAARWRRLHRPRGRAALAEPEHRP
jgi:hypothetical protein